MNAEERFNLIESVMKKAYMEKIPDRITNLIMGHTLRMEHTYGKEIAAGVFLAMVGVAIEIYDPSTSALVSLLAGGGRVSDKCHRANCPHIDECKGLEPKALQMLGEVPEEAEEPVETPIPEYLLRSFGGPLN